MPKHRLIGAEVSLYTGKVRAYLRFKGIAFDEVPATREVYMQTIVPRTGVRFIPVLISDDDVAVQDSTAIIDFLEQRYPEPGVYPKTPLQRLVALLLEVYGDEWLVIPAMHYRWSFPENRAFAVREFGALSAPELTADQQVELGEKLAVPFASAIVPLGVSADTAPAIEASYLALLRELDAHFAQQPYLLGTRPSIGDFGLIGPLYAHLHRDPYSGRLMRERAPHVTAWVARMNRPAPGPGEFLTDDCVPQTLEPVLARMFREQGPVLSSTVDALSRWAAKKSGALPRTLGEHEFTVEGVRGKRRIYPFNLWRWQRPYDHFHALAGESATCARALLERVGGLSTISAPIGPRLRRERNVLVV
jgi:glutathione S-transferase